MISKLKDRLTEFTISEKQIQRGDEESISGIYQTITKMPLICTIRIQKGRREQWDWEKSLKK